MTAIILDCYFWIRGYDNFSPLMIFNRPNLSRSCHRGDWERPRACFSSEAHCTTGRLSGRSCRHWGSLWRLNQNAVMSCRHLSRAPIALDFKTCAVLALKVWRVQVGNLRRSTRLLVGPGLATSLQALQRGVRIEHHRQWLFGLCRIWLRKIILLRRGCLRCSNRRRSLMRTILFHDGHFFDHHLIPSFREVCWHLTTFRLNLSWRSGYGNVGHRAKLPITGRYRRHLLGYSFGGTCQRQRLLHLVLL